MGSEFSRFIRYLMLPVMLLGMLSVLPVLLKEAKTVTSDLNPGSVHSTLTRPPAPPISHPAAAPPATSHPVDWSVAITVGATAIAIVVAIAIGIAVWVWISRHRERARQHAARRRTQLDRWSKAVGVFDEVCAALAGFETDPESIYFTRPLLADVTEPASAAFYTALAAAQDRHTEMVPVDDEAIAAFAAAAGAARTAFDTADANARRKARNGIVRDEHGERALSDKERRKVGQARKLLAQALDATATPQFARNAHEKALSLLAEVGVDVPQRLVVKVIDALDTSRRLALAGPEGHGNLR